MYKKTPGRSTQPGVLFALRFLFLLQQCAHMSFNNPFRKLETIAAAGLAALGATEAQANATEGDMAEALRANVAGHETVLQAGAPEVIRANVARDANGLPLVNPLKGDFVSQPHSDKLPLKGPQE